MYKKAYEVINAITDVLQVSLKTLFKISLPFDKATVKDTSATAYFASITQMLQQGKAYPDLEVLAYCYAATISMLDIAVIQN